MANTTNHLGAMMCLVSERPGEGWVSLGPVMLELSLKELASSRGKMRLQSDLVHTFTTLIDWFSFIRHSFSTYHKLPVS